MGSTDPLTAARFPQSQDAPDIATYIQQAVNDLSAVSIPYFASTSARNSAFAAWVAAGHSMRDGLKSHVQGIGEQTYLSGSWVNYTSDTGWVSIAPNSPITQGAVGCAYRVRGGWCEVSIDAAYNGVWGSNFIMFTLPGTAAPTRKLYFPTTWYGDASAYVYVDTSGNVAQAGASSTRTGMVGAFSFPVG